MPTQLQKGLTGLAVRVGRLKRILETIDYQREGVKENLLCMFEREKKRIILEAAEVERARGPPGIQPGQNGTRPAQGGGEGTGGAVDV